MVTAAAKRGAAATLAVLMAFALSGCGDDEARVGGAGSGASDADSDAAGVVDASESETVAEEDPVVEEPVVEVVGDDQCLHGNWYLENESFAALLNAAGGTGAEVTGFVVLSFSPDGQAMMTTYDHWTTVFTVDGGTATMVRNGDDIGTYAVEGDVMTMTETDGNSVVEMTVSMGDGQPVTMTPEHETAPVSNGTFTCDAETLTVSADGGTTSFFREH